jgi:hypothetical protein
MKPALQSPDQAIGPRAVVTEFRPAPPHIVATPFAWRDPGEIPRRQWLFGRHAQRRYVSVTGADGGVGKTALALTEAISLVTGRPLLNDGKIERAPAWYLGLEDDRDEYERRVAATLLAHRIEPSELRGGFFWDSGRDQEFIIVRETRDGLSIVEPILEGIKARIAEHNIALLTVDPFIASHAVSENDNGKIDFVMRQWAMIAEETGCAIELNHHTRKGNGQSEQTADDLRGAGAMVRAARSVRVLLQMTKEEAQRAGVDSRKRFFRVVSAKANVALHTDEGAWRELVSIDLRNGDGVHLGDLVQAAAFWRFPDASDACTPEQLEEVRVAIAGGEWRENVQAANWAGLAVARALGLDASDPAAKESIKRAIRGWLADGTLVLVTKLDHKRMPKQFVTVPK